MKKFIVSLFAAMLLFSASASAVTPEPKHTGGYSAEYLRLEKLPVGYLIALKEIPQVGTHWLDFTFKLGTFNATGGSHLAIGLGDLYKYYETGAVPNGDGFVVGKANACESKGVAVNLESYGGLESGKVLDCPTAFGPLSTTAIYQVRITVSEKGVVKFSVHAEDDTLLWTATRSWTGSYPEFRRGLFVIPINASGVTQGSYELLSLQAGVELP